MQVKSISARNFKTLVDFKFEIGPGYSAISGMNNCGKTSVFRIIEYFLKSGANDGFPYNSENSIKYDRDFTQWADAGESIDVSIDLLISKSDDSEIFGFVERFSDDVGEKESIELKSRAVFSKDETVKLSCYIDGVPQDERGSDEIVKKLRATNNLTIHNSTKNEKGFYFVGDSFVEILEAHFSIDDRKSIAAAQKNLQNRVRKAAKQHKAELDKLLGKTKDRIHVELTALGGEKLSKFPLQMKLSDKVSEVALQEWGAGTQNRTRVFMSILDAQHSKETASDTNKSTPIFLVEEPESFLHPSAQAEFGQILNDLADEFGLQIVATTHSPYMLNQSDPRANFLLERRLFRRMPRETILVKSDDEDWMAPFAENLGVIKSEFHDWKQAFSASSSEVILVEGDIDKEYFELFRDNYPNIYKIPDKVEIVPYEGKDALKNTALLRFMINKFRRVFITFDLDAEKELSSSLLRLGLTQGSDFMPVGQKRAGCECIEGLLPDALKVSVNAINVDDVNAMMSGDHKVRKNARQKLKRAYLEYLRHHPQEEKDLVGFKVFFAKVAKAF
ncbi:AAA family ATPase [Altererythrobacter luteolus]|uniref:AAA family ATPase n=1 Tax=Pontixanthobacter luteolus TaxID=295089 RepID=A0A6I4V1P7_9SPHN|nr:AAA family ATPase [Pontixanthobacter luteolus]MXP46304.1 AAA family ATPase [Pontixanthobacter luteolus]